MVADFKKKQKANLYSKVFIALGGIGITLLAAVLVVADVKMYKKKQELNTQVQSLKNKIEELKDRREELKQGIANSDNDAYIEKVAREELDLQKPGEKVVSFVVPEKPAAKVTVAGQQNLLQNFTAWVAGWFKK